MPTRAPRRIAGSCLGQAGAEGDEAGDAFVAADVWEFNGCNGRARGAGGGAGGGVEVL